MSASPPSGFLIFSVLAAALIVAGAVAAATPVFVTAEGRGVALLDGGTVVVRAPRDATVTAVSARAGQLVERGALLVAFDGSAVMAPATGQVDFVDVRPGDVVARGAALAEIVPSDEPLVGYVALPVRHRGKVRPGLLIRLRPEGDDADDGAETAEIDDVSEQPLSDARAAQIFGAAGVPREPSFLARFRFGPGSKLRYGHSFVGEIALGRRSALSIVVPWLGGS